MVFLFTVIRQTLLLAFLLTYSLAHSQENEVLSSLPKKGSYLYYVQPAFEDNSFMMEEAINQEKGIMQYISNFYFDKIPGGDFLYTFNQDIPLGGPRHQLNYSVNYHIRKTTTANENTSGLGDLTLGYHYMLAGKKDWAMVVPGFTLIIPTGSAIDGRGVGGIGGQVSLAVTKRISHKMVTNYNVGYTYVSQADGYITTVSGAPILAYERDLEYSSLGAGIIWYPIRKLTLFSEFVFNALTDITADGSIKHRHLTTVNPGFRFAIDHNNVQIVPGFSVPLIFTDGALTRTGIFFYLSFETEYLPFTRQKHR